jgi:hypothetical protein
LDVERADAPIGDQGSRVHGGELNDGVEEGEAPRGDGSFLMHKHPGTTHLDNNHGRLATVLYEEFVVVDVSHLGYFKETYGTTFIPESFGIHFSSNDRVVRIPKGMVGTLGAYLVGKIPSQETYLSCQAFCRSLSRTIDFDTVELMEDCAIYAPYLAMVRRAHERESIHRKLGGRVYTRAAQACALGAGALGVVASLPVVSAANTLGVGAGYGIGAGFAAAAAVTIGGALAIRKSLKYFRPDEGHPKLASRNSTAPPPPSDPAAEITRLQLEKKAPDATRADAARVTGIAVADHEPTIFAKNQDNTVAALLKRSACLPPPFDKADRDAYITWTLKNWRHMVGPTFKIESPSTPEEFLQSVDAWADGSNSSTDAIARYKAAARELVDLGITCTSQLSPAQLHEFTKRDLSVKLETVLKDEDKSPRQILAASPHFVVLTAPFIKGLTGVVRKAWRVGSKLVYAPGLASKAIADDMTRRVWRHKAKVDFKGYDSCQDDSNADMEISVCKLYHAPRATTDLMRANKKTHGTSREGVRFKTPYKRNSGDPWTTLFNTVLNATLMAYCICVTHRVSFKDMQALIFAGGDDGAIFYDGDYVDFTGLLSALGYPVEMKHVADLEDIEFLSCRLTETATGWNLVPMAGKTIAKLGYSVRANNDKKAKMIARGAAKSMYAASNGCPPLRMYLDHVLRVTDGVEALRPRDEPWKMTQCDTGAPTTETWAHLEKIYGWTRELQAEVDANLAKLATPGTIVESAGLDLLCRVDSGHERHSFHPEALDRPGYSWAVSRTLRNARQHALNGNTSHYGEPMPIPASTSSTMFVDDDGDVKTVYYNQPGFSGSISIREDNDNLGEPGSPECTAYVKLDDHVRGDAVEFTVGTSLRTIVDTAFDCEVDLTRFIVTVDGKLVHVLDDCYPHEDAFIILRSKGVGGSQCLVCFHGNTCVVDGATTVWDALCKAEESLGFCGALRLDDVLVTVDGRPVSDYHAGVPDGANITCDSKGRGGSMGASAVALATALIMKLRPAASALQIHEVASAIVNDVLTDVMFSESKKDDELHLSFQGVLHQFSANGDSYLRVFSLCTGIATGYATNMLITVDGRPGDWKATACKPFTVTVKGLGGSGTVSRSERLLKTVMERAGLMDTSRGALLVAFDPFHDHDERVTGWPDAVSSPSVVECYKTSFVVTTSQGSTLNWDCDIVMMPDLVPSFRTNWTNSSNFAGGPSNTWLATSVGSPAVYPSYLTGGVTTYQGVAGAQLTLGTVSSTFAPLPTQTTSGSGRAFSYGIEIVNDTAPLYQQGTLTVWRQPMPSTADASTQQYAAASTATFGGSTTTSNIGSVSGVITPAPPNNVAEAMLLPGSRQWHAKEGAMLVNTLNSFEIPAINNQTCYNLFYEDSPTDVINLGPAPSSSVQLSPFSAVSAGLQYMYFNRTYLTPFNMTGAYLSGLSPQTALTVNVRVYAEVFPSQLGNVLTPIAQPSAPYDPVCAALYAEIIKGLPPGVMLCENGFGDFFKDVVSKISSFVSPVANFVKGIAGSIPHPAAQAVSRVADMVGNVSGQFVPASTEVYSAPERNLTGVEPRTRQPRMRARAASQAKRVTAKVRTKKASKIGRMRR